MNPQAVHTPTPWIAEATNARGEIEIEADSTGRGYVHGGQDTVIARIPMRPLDRKDAEFIVRAVKFSRLHLGDEWQHADSIGMCCYRDPLDPFENCYVVDLMKSAIDARKAHVEDMAGAI